MSNNKSTSNLSVSQKLELWTKQQREFQQAAATADSERERLMGRLTEIKTNTTKIRHATLQAKDSLGKHHMVFRQLQAKKKQLERQLQAERAQSEACALQLATLNTAVFAFQKQAADQYHTLNKEIAQVNKECIDDITKSYITLDSVRVLEKSSSVTTTAPALAVAADGSQRIDTAALYADMKRDLAELGQLDHTRKALTTRLKSWRARVLGSSKRSHNPSITKASLLELERNWNSNGGEANDKKTAGPNDTVQLQLFYGQERRE